MGNKIQKIYVGTNQVRPIPPREYFYDFIEAWSVAQMQADWWQFTRQSGTATSWWQFTSNWLHNTNTWSSNKFGNIIALWVISNCIWAKKITIQVEHYLVSGSWNWGSSYRFGDWTTYSSWGAINSMNNSGYNGYNWRTPSNTIWNRVSLWTWNYTGTTVLDLVNKTQVTSLTWNSDINLTLSDSDIANTQTFNAVGLGFDNVWNYYKSIYVKVEF
jgi:hypothetical protein